jgi:O-antigen ligase
MAIDGERTPPRTDLLSRFLQRFEVTGLLVILCAFTLTTWDGGEIASRIVCAILFLFTAAFFGLRKRRTVYFPLPAICLLAMTGYGILQTLFFPQKITASGWSGVLFWFAAACITLVSAQIFRVTHESVFFRHAFVIFGTALCVLDLLQQASQTRNYFWFIPSRYSAIFGPFAYWNNFAEFVELVLPITLWRGLGHRRPNVPYLLCGALQIGAVVASGSRAGAALVIIELLTVIGLAFAKHKNKALLIGGALAIALSVFFVYAAGFETLIEKLQHNDLLAVRRNIDRSSLAMIQQRPLTGWGLDTYVPVYRMFALYDDGTFVNRAHNDWLQWAAEGGIFFALAMVIVLAWSIRPAIRSGWGIGLIAICIHALVDYPFARLGVCGWYFCLLGMLAAGRQVQAKAGIPGQQSPGNALGLRLVSRRT